METAETVETPAELMIMKEMWAQTVKAEIPPSLTPAIRASSKVCKLKMRKELEAQTVQALIRIKL